MALNDSSTFPIVPLICCSNFVNFKSNNFCLDIKSYPDLEENINYCLSGLIHFRDGCIEWPAGWLAGMGTKIIKKFVVLSSFYSFNFLLCCCHCFRPHQLTQLLNNIVRCILGEISMVLMSKKFQLITFWSQSMLSLSVHLPVVPAAQCPLFSLRDLCVP